MAQASDRQVVPHPGRRWTGLTDTAAGLQPGEAYHRPRRALAPLLRGLARGARHVK